MNANEAANGEGIQQAVIEKLALLSLDKQKEALAFIEDLASEAAATSTKAGQTLWELAQECIKDVPPEAFEELPTDGALNHDHYLYGAPKKYDEHGAPIDYEPLG